MGGGALIKLGIGGFFVFASAQMGSVAQDLLQRARESVQASELSTLDGHLAAWVIEQKRGRPPRDQDHFEQVCRQLFTARGGRDVTRDRWGEAYVYDKIHDRPPEWEISSKGPDKRLGTEDDLVVHRREDQVHLNKDPAKIIEGAIERLKRQDEQRLRELERVGRELDRKGLKDAGKSADAPAFAEGEPGPDQAPLQKRALEQQLNELDALLRKA
ncbi:MAG: hypothetical protein AB7N76_13480 [Planctomycetota bacterium]